MRRTPQHRPSILHRWPALALALAACGPLAAQAVDGLLQQRIEGQIESKLLGTVERTLDAGVGALASKALDQVVEKLPPRAERFLPDLDTAGRGFEHGVWVLLVAPQQVEGIERRGFKVRELRRLVGLRRVLIRIEAPADGDLAQVARELALDAPDTRIDLNHVYRGMAEDPSAAPAAAPAARRGPRVKLGIIDSAVATGHEALRKAHIEQRDFVSYDRPRPTDHGTAVASILVGDSATLHGVVRGARLHAASVFFEDAAGESAATTASLVQALDWLVASGVRVVNMSLAGPPNRVLEAAIAQVSAEGTVVVAAVGNNGPQGEPLYPAAYAPVVGITAIDSQRRIYLYANRGRQVMFAAPGVEIAVARGAGGYGTHSGTSMAAPYAAAIIARALAAHAATPQRALSRLKAAAIDLGDAGLDETFGYGLIAPAE